MDWHHCLKITRQSVKMDVPESRLDTPDKFPFPFTPYSIQEDLMRKLYETLEEKKLGIFESPTGTGKSMSLICGSLKWLLDAQKRVKRDVEKKIEEMNKELRTTPESVNWLEEQCLRVKTKQSRDSLQDFLNKILMMENRISEIEMKAKKISNKSTEVQSLKLKEGRNYKNFKSSSEHKGGNSMSEEPSDTDVLLDDFKLSDEETFCNEKGEDIEIENNDCYHGIKIFLCSRTHSQLTQLVKEIQKSPYKDLKIRVVSLASRQNYCINQSVLNLKHLPLINEKCQDLISGKKERVMVKSKLGKPIKKQKTSRNCPFNERLNIENLKVKVLTEIQDIEHLIDWGKIFNGCPYYASRSAVDEAQIILVPYNTILHKNTRQACGISIKNSIVIIDEAHNLLDVIGNLYSCSVSGLELVSSEMQLIQYKDKYGEKLSSYNLLCLNQLLFVINKLLKSLRSHSSSSKNNEVKTTVDTLAGFITSCEIDSINFFKILEFVTKSKIVNKIRGFISRQDGFVAIQKKEKKGVSAFLKTLTEGNEFKPPDDETEDKSVLNINPLLNVVSFLKCLSEHCLDARVVSTQSNTIGDSSLKFLLLNPASEFRDIVKEARSVVLAGGTMQPFSEFTDQLFHLAGANPDRITIFSCGHVISPNNILPIILSSGPSGKNLDFSYRQRNDPENLDEFGRLLSNVCNVTPKGIVCFFPSYEYKALVFRHLLETNVIDKIQKKKRVLIEPRNSNKVEEVLKDYGAAVEENGAVLFSVVGGKLSEGLNFNDDLGRCVIVVGLPYPNLKNPELKEKMNYLDNTMGSGAGKIYYENLCMKAVNQSIGRSVRHKNDYASVLLVDARYSRPECVKALPEWIRRSLRNEIKFGTAVGLLAKFFASKKLRAT